MNSLESNPRQLENVERFKARCSKMTHRIHPLRYIIRRDFSLFLYFEDKNINNFIKFFSKIFFSVIMNKMSQLNEGCGSSV